MDSEEFSIGHVKPIEGLHLKRKYAYGIGGLPMQLTTSGISFYLSLFLLEVAQMTPYHLFIVILIGRLWDAITDPFAGYIVTKTDTRWGRFKPYMLASLPFLCISFFCLFFEPGIKNHWWKLSYYLFVMLVFQTSVTFYFIPYGSMCMVLTCEISERDQLTAYRMIFEILGLLFGSAYFGTIISIYKDTEVCKDGLNLTESSINLQQKGYIIATLSCIILIVVCVLVTIFGSVEQNVFIENEKFNLQFYKLVFTFKPYLILMLTFSCTAIGTMLVQANMALYITYVLNIPQHISKGILVMIFFSIICIPIGQKLNNKIGKKLTYFSGMVTIMPILFSIIIMPRNPNLIIYYGSMICTSYPVMIAFFLPWSMLPDCIDYFAVTHDIRKEATLFSLFVFFQKFALGFAVGMTGIVLGLADYQSNMCVQPESVSTSLRYFVGIGSSFFYIFAMVSLYFYPLNEEKQSEIQSRIKQGRSRKRISVITKAGMLKKDAYNI